MADSKEQKSADEYRPSASIIIVAKTSTVVNYDYKVLLCKRSGPTAFAPEHCVFPGGIFEKSADESLAWLRYFFTFGLPEKRLIELCRKGDKRPEPILTSGIHFSRDISLRITAIREAFEETGILFCRDRHTINLANGVGCYTENFDRAYWQKAVHDDPSKFLKLCRSLDAVPDLWSLYEWSAWRSPHNAEKKYDTVYYIVLVESIPNLLLERGEIEDAMWYTPLNCFKMFEKRKIWLPTTIYYEVARLSQIHKWKNLLQFSQRRSKSETILFVPALIRCEDCMIMLLDGDEFYPKNPYKPVKINSMRLNSKTLRERSKKHHRLVLRDMHNYCVEFTIYPFHDHLSPLTKEDKKKVHQSML